MWSPDFLLYLILLPCGLKWNLVLSGNNVVFCEPSITTPLPFGLRRGF